MIAGLDIYHPSPIGPPFAFFRAAHQHGLRFVWIKATEGEGLKSPSYLVRADAARACGLHVGPYHYAHPDLRAKDAIREARACRKIAGGWSPGYLPSALDLEHDSGPSRLGRRPTGLTPRQIIAWALAWLQETEQLCGRTPMLYTYTSFWAEKLARTAELAGYPLWQAHYPKPGGEALAIPGWPWTFWQWTGTGRLLWAPGAGATADWDLNWFRGDELALARFCGCVELPEAPT